MTEPKQRRKPRKYTDGFKQQLVDLYHFGKHQCHICREYDIAHFNYICLRGNHESRVTEVIKKHLERWEQII